MSLRFYTVAGKFRNLWTHLVAYHLTEGEEAPLTRRAAPGVPPCLTADPRGQEIPSARKCILFIKDIIFIVS